MTTEEPRVHLLKCWPEGFRAIKSAAKRYEVRKDDRGYMVGDILNLREFEPTPSAKRWTADGTWYTPNAEYQCGTGRFTGEELWVRVTYKTPGGSFGLPADVCVLGIALSEEPKP